MIHPPMAHQAEALRRSNGREAFGYLMEMGTGKTYTTLADAERAYGAGVIDAVFIVAPNGVHTNWVRREIPTHVSVPHIAAAHYSAGGKRRAAEVEKLFKVRDPGDVPPLRILAMSYDALNTNDGFKVASRFLLATKAMMVADESVRIKNPTTARTKNVMRLRLHAVLRRILSGLPVTNSPVDIFAQMEFLEEGLLGTTSHRAFTAEYCDLVPQDSQLIKNIKKKLPARIAAFAQPQIVAKNTDGTKRFRNLDKLQGLLAPHTFRVLKCDCLDLPEKIYTTHYFELAPKQRAAYTLLEEDLRLELDGEKFAVKRLAAMVKLQQITSGFVLVEGEPRLLEDNPRMAALLEIMEDLPGKVLIWARFTAEVHEIARRLRALGHEVVEYHGATSREDREAAIEAVQTGTATVFVGNAQAGGIGLTLTAAETTIYYSNDYNLDTRKQSEDRNHRIGTKNNVTYIDLVALDTKDEEIAAALQAKEKVASAVLGDDNSSSELKKVVVAT